ncbi:MAG: glycosyltransferase [Bacteroidetes bacterium]|nr:MAG: glycosyltransferase [Bacteroidota bacterium]
MHILYLSYDGLTDPLGQSQVLPYLRGLSASGYRITVASFEKREAYVLHQETIAQFCELHGLRWIPLSYTKHPPILSTLFDIVKLWRLVQRLHREEHFRLVHCRSYITALVGLRMKQRYGCKFLFDMRGFWVDERVEGGIWSLGNPLFQFIYRYFKRKEKEFFENADHIICLTEAGRTEIHSWPLVNQPVPITVIPCCADLSLFSYEHILPTRQAAYRSALGLPANSLTLSYLGSIGTWYMLPEMLTFFKVLRKRVRDAHFLFITGENPEVIEKEALRQGIPLDSLTIKRANRQEVPYYLSLSDISIFFCKPVFSKIASSPTKQAEIMGMGIPVICNDKVGDTAQIIDETGAGIVLSLFEKNVYEKVVDRVEEALAIPKEKIRAGALKYYSLENGVAQYLRVYQELLN